MAEQNHLAYCRQCGNRVQPENRFCGSCGAAVLIPMSHADQIIPQPVAASHVPTSRGGSKPFLLAGILGVLLVGGVAVALLGIGFGSVSTDEPPDPAFDLYLTPLESMTEAPIMLPAELPEALENIGVNENVEGNGYAITFLSTPPDELVGGWGMFETVGTLQAVPESEHEPTPGFRTTSTEYVTLPDGTEAQLRRMEPASDTANYGPRWQGTFEREGYVYTFWTSIGQNGEDIATQALSTMVLVE